MKRIFVTGATGFVGTVLCRVLADHGYVVRAAVRPGRAVPEGCSEHALIDDLVTYSQWPSALAGVDFVMHLAARAHVLNDPRQNAGRYVAINAEATQRLAQAAAEAGVRRFVYLSSIKVNGEETTGRAYTALDTPSPLDAYGESKWLGEQHVMAVANAGSMQAAIVRPPLIYGPGVRANFLRLLRWVDAERPLPLGAIHNRRSLVSIWNLCDLLIRVLESPAAAGRPWMVSDGADCSTPELIRMIATAMNRRARLLYVPVGLLQVGGLLIGKRAEIARLCGSLAVDITATRKELDWSPPLSGAEAISRTVQWYLTKGAHAD
jgi:nucleoside-diphosphate-sugar epimerase